jgi:sterol desaturase/sphingolipid hydroxylase (fatty acid hydroxylase superfamily)
MADLAYPDPISRAGCLEAFYAQPRALARAQTGRPLKPALTGVAASYLQPAMVVATLLFWSLGPLSLTTNPWTIVVTSSLTTLFVLWLELANERHASWRMNAREFLTDLFYVVLSSTVISWFSTKLAEDPLKAAKHALGIATPWAMHMPFLVQVALVIFLVEFGQYWMHRLMHNQSFFWSTHAPHHHLTQLNAAKGAVGNPIELFLISLSVVTLFDLPLPALFCAFSVLGIVATFAHANTRFDPPTWYGFVFTTIRNHSLHHSTGYEETRCNYGNSLILLDRIFGTYRDGEAEAVGQDARRRLSIVEQTLFPFRPAIARMKARREHVEAVLASLPAGAIAGRPSPAVARTTARF